MENKQKHLEFIQAIINRMSGNSFILKGWAVTLIAALFTIFLKDGNHEYFSVLYFPVAIFWILDGYFLSRERLFRSLYDHVRQLDDAKIDFCMDITNFKNWNNSWFGSTFFSINFPFYITLVGVILITTNLII